MNNVKQLVRNAIRYCCLVNNFGTFFRLAPLERDLGVVKQSTDSIGSAPLPLRSSQSCYAGNYLLSCILLTVLSLLREEGLVASHLGWECGSGKEEWAMFYSSLFPFNSSGGQRKLARE